MRRSCTPTRRMPRSPPCGTEFKTHDCSPIRNQVQFTRRTRRSTKENEIHSLRRGERDAAMTLLSAEINIFFEWVSIVNAFQSFISILFCFSFASFVLKRFKDASNANRTRTTDDLYRGGAGKEAAGEGTQAQLSGSHRDY